MRCREGRNCWVVVMGTFALLGVVGARGWAGEAMPSLAERFAGDQVAETPSFQKHVVPLFGRLGCNGRACHGSFQGQGGFRLSLFGYDFRADHQALLDEESPRVDLAEPLESLILIKPTDEDMHDGGLRYEKGSWQYHVFRRWIEEGAPFSEGDVKRLASLDVEPKEISFGKKGQQVQLRAVARWKDGTAEDVTCLCRFQSNNEQIAVVDENGHITAGSPGDTHVVVSYDNAVVPVPVLQPVSPLTGDRYPDVPTPTRIDELVVAKLRKLGIVPSEVCTDSEFLRRVKLDLTGTLPTPEEVREFLADTRPDKRERKVDELLQTPAYAAWWTTRLCDYTGNNGAQLVNVGPVRGRESQFWYDWIYQRVAANVPYDELVEGIVVATSREPGEEYLEYCREMSAIYRGDEGHAFADRATMPYYWARRNLRQPEERAIGFAYSFMGVRIQCAQCHKHPFDRWSKDDFDAFKNLFTRVSFATTGGRDGRAEFQKLVNDLGLKGKRGGQLQRELQKKVREGKTVPFPEVVATGPTRSTARNKSASATNSRSGPTARILGGDEIALNDYPDPRVPLMEWLRRKDNPYFARALVNRVWSNYFNVGIVDPPDDMNLANPPSNRALLDYLASEFVEHDYDMRWLHREITTSRTYQLSWRTNETNKDDLRHFSHAVPRRLPAEVLVDAIQQATASDDRVGEMQRDMKGRAIALASATNRAANNGPQYALNVFGRSTRESNCDCDRSSEASLLQTVFLQNDRDVLASLDRKQDGWLVQLDQQWKDSASQSDKTIDSLEQQVQRLARQRESLKQQILRAPKGQLPSIRKRLARVTEQWETQRAALDRELKSLSEAARREKADAVPLIEAAYLRTVSRFPTAEEIETSREFVEQSESLTDGMRGLLWALLNTKEFIVNH